SVAVAARSVSPRTVEESEKAIAARAAESHSTAKSALPFARLFRDEPLVGIRDSWGSEQAHRRGHGNRLQPRSIGFERGHLDPNPARPANGGPGSGPDRRQAGVRGRGGEGAGAAL